MDYPLCYTLAVADRLTKEKLLEFLGHLGAEAKTPGVCFITGGTCAILLGWRETTIDVDFKFDPEPAGDEESFQSRVKEFVRASSHA